MVVHIVSVIVIVGLMAGAVLEDKLTRAVALLFVFMFAYAALEYVKKRLDTKPKLKLIRGGKQ